MARDDRSLYEITINGIKHSVKLSPKDAERYGDAAQKIDAKKAPANKSASGETK